MILRQSWVQICDSSSALWIKIFHIYGGFWVRWAKVSSVIKGSVKSIKPDTDFMKGYVVKKILKGAVSRSQLVRARTSRASVYPLNLSFNHNSSVLIKKKNTFKSVHLIGPATRLLRNKRVLSLFKGVL